MEKIIYVVKEISCWNNIELSIKYKELRQEL